MKTKSKIISITLILCMIFSLSFTAFAAGKGYSDVSRIYIIEGVNGKKNVAAYALLYGDIAKPENNYAFLMNMKRSGEAFVDVISKAELDKIVTSSVASSQLDIKNFNELMLSEGVPDDYLMIDEKPDTVSGIEKAITAGKNTVTLKDNLVVFPDALQLAASSGITQIHFDTIVDKSVNVRISLNPAKATKGFGTLAFTQNYIDDPVKKTIEKYYTNKFVLISMIQIGSFGTTVNVAAKIDGLNKLDTKNLVFSSYDRLTNKITAIKNPNYSIDDKGFLHFDTTYGGTIIITDKALTKK